MKRKFALVALAAAIAALPAAAQIRKCQGPNGLSYADGNCPAGTRPLDLLPDSKAGNPVKGAGAVADTALPTADTGIAMITQLPGKFAWLDDHTLAVTTFGDPKAKVPWMVRKIVTWDSGTHAQATLVPRGFIDCTNAEYGLVGLELGDLESRFAVGSTAPPAKQQFQLWNAATHTLAQAPAEYQAAWHPKVCLKPDQEDLAVDDLLGSKKPLRYLQPEHGTLDWSGRDAQGHLEGPALITPRRKVLLKGLSINEISHAVRYLPYRNGYQLEAGVHDHAFDPPKNLALVTMDAEGRIARRDIPATLTQALDAAGATGPATMVAVKSGELVMQGGSPATGGGLYLVRGEKAERIWCTATPAPGQAAGAGACAMTQPPAISPDGCRIAFDAPAATPLPAPFSDAPTIKVIELCTASELGAAQKHLQAKR